MNEINQNERIASERLSSLESPTRRLLIKGMAGLGATLVSSSLSAAIAAQTQTHQPGAPGNQAPPDQVGWDLLLHRALKVDISTLFTRRPQPKGTCRLVSNTPSGFLTISRP